ncbi:heavy metal translocating P-type ATPase [Alkaliphilus sp. B6464]|uniref:heavy metal translocating P-type ATPase n=1 Tax=Alkaliphilus sp. B6464 TaxID=2731219 RepID=UPI001BA44C62|nr:cation-translocating P-type ATPase [Alkaliphilus sp. B6464]QUH20046.1 cation-translocating P-type ATPase [Alkaliphilus sp. B6464]
MFKISKFQRIVVSGVMIVISLLLNYLALYKTLSNMLLVVAAIISGYPIALNAIRALRYKILGIDALVTTAVIGAFFIQEYFEMAAVTFLFMFGNYLESRTLEKTRSSIKALLDLAPDRARVIRDDMEVEVLPEEVVKGDIVIVKPGEKIPVDGTVIEGKAYVNQAAITGESVPISRENGEGIFSGTIIESGYLKITADRVGEDTTFARILEMVEEAQDKKAKTQKFLEVFSKYYTPGIIVLTVIVYLLTKDIELALTLLVIACPGALVISAPVSVVAGIGNGAKHGVLIKGGEIIEKMGKVRVIAFDKTGTLTIGRPQITNIKSYGLGENEILKLTASGELYSEHPLAKAILEGAKDRNILGLIKPEYTEIITGQGLIAKIGDTNILIGNRKLLQSNGIAIYEEVEKYIQKEESEAQTVVLVADSEKLLGVISIADKLRPDGAELIKKLKSQGIKKVVMLTGDNRLAAKSIANRLGLDDYYAELLPEDKVTKLKDLQEKHGMTAMVGDGVNDAPALATADLGIAIGGAGSDVAMETADVVLMSDELNKVSYAVGLSRATVRNMKQNIYFAIVVVIGLIIGVLGKTVFLSAGMLIHEMSVLLVIVNAVRLLKYEEK